MTDRPVTARPGIVTDIPSQLEPDAIGATENTVIGIANAAPAVSVGLTLAALAATSAYASGPTILLCAVPMLIIANAYRRLNLWKNNCGASFEWVGRAINPYLGFFTGWLMIAGNFAGTTAGVVVLAPSVLAIFGANATSTWPNILISTAVVLVMLVIAIVGIRPTARTQLGMGLTEYVILIGFAIAGFIAVLGHHPGTFPITKGWFSINGIGGKADVPAGLLIAVFMFTGWDATVYVNEEVKGRRLNPGKAAVLAVAFLAVVFIVSEMGLQGVVSPAKLQANASSALVYVAEALGGGGWAKVMAFGLALSVIATTLTGIVILARILYGMASYKVLPPVLGNVNRRFSTPVVSSLLVGLLFVAIIWAYLLSNSIANVFTDLINVTGIVCAAFYGITALSAVVYYRRRVFSNWWDGLLVGILPFCAAGFLVWMIVKALQTAPSAQIWTLVSIVGVGVVLMLIARFGHRSTFFQLPRESASKEP
jgi:amino acid transporter